MHQQPIACGLLLRHGGHLPALVGAPPASLCTGLAVIHAVLGALISADLANLGTGTAHSLRVFARATHHGSGELANLRAVDVKRDAARHHPHILLLQAGGRTVVARFRAVIAGSYTAGEVLVWHEIAKSKFVSNALRQRVLLQRRKSAPLPAGYGGIDALPFLFFCKPSIWFAW
ncbi:hypothetical protein [Ramlibacter aurantiacus]|uniref:hypothetical protein n=1 Tax=Ramlibacter aurantiacus TaxID=2801330 RepID=UPI003F49227A